jgi:hypothetical protein
MFGRAMIVTLLKDGQIDALAFCVTKKSTCLSFSLRNAAIEIVAKQVNIETPPVTVISMNLTFN